MPSADSCDLSNHRGDTISIATRGERKICSSRREIARKEYSNSVGYARVAESVNPIESERTKRVSVCRWKREDFAR